MGFGCRMVLMMVLIVNVLVLLSLIMLGCSSYCSWSLFIMVRIVVVVEVIVFGLEMFF